jgi:rare lipoprotein A (peptidoglycan hydrolase)
MGREYMVKIAGQFRGFWGLLLITATLLGGCAYLPKGLADMEVGARERGIASWYGEGFIGQLTASGEVYDGKALTGAHRSLPLGTVIKVTNAQNGRQIRVRINDRGPYASGRILDLSLSAAVKLDFVTQGTTPILLEVVGAGKEEFPTNPGHWRWIESILSFERDLGQAPEVDETVPAEMVNPVQVGLDHEQDRHHRRMAPGDLVLGRRLRREIDHRSAEPEGEEVPALELS